MGTSKGKLAVLFGLAAVLSGWHGCEDRDEDGFGITSVSPNSGSETGGTLITISGKGFVSGVTVTIGGNAATSVTVVNATTLTAITPVGSVGANNVVVTLNGNSKTLGGGFTYIAAEIYVSLNTLDRVDVYAVSASGAASATRSISGSMSGPIGIAVAGGELFVANPNSDTVTVYTSSATGVQAPLRTFSVLSLPTGVYVDLTRSEIFVADAIADNVTVYNLSGGAAIRTLSGAATGMDQPEGVFGLDGELFVANGASAQNSITVYDLTADGNTAFKRRIQGASTGLDNPQAFCVSGGLIFVANRDGDSITVYNKSDSGNVTPVRTLTGAATTIDEPQAVYATMTELFVASRLTDTITVFNIADAGNTAPKRTITGVVEPEGLIVR